MDSIPTGGNFLTIFFALPCMKICQIIWQTRVSWKNPIVLFKWMRIGLSGGYRILQSILRKLRLVHVSFSWHRFTWRYDAMSCKGCCPKYNFSTFQWSVARTILVKVMSPTITFWLISAPWLAARACSLSSPGGDSSCSWVLVHALDHNLGREWGNNH